MTAAQSFDTENIEIALLRPHPRNYNAHPADQLEHIAQSIREHGIYRPVIVARDNTILAGHGVVQAARTVLGWTHIPAVRKNYAPDSPKALKLLTADNEIAHLGEKDDRLLSQLLKEIKDQDADGLAGTGYDEQMLANLIFVTRPKHEIQDHNEAAHWVGMPEYDGGEQPIKLVLNFKSREDRDRLLALIGVDAAIYGEGSGTASAWWPVKGYEDVASLHFVG